MEKIKVHFPENILIFEGFKNLCSLGWIYFWPLSLGRPSSLSSLSFGVGVGRPSLVCLLSFFVAFAPPPPFRFLFFFPPAEAESENDNDGSHAHDHRRRTSRSKPTCFRPLLLPLHTKKGVKSVFFPPRRKKRERTAAAIMYRN